MPNGVPPLAEHGLFSITASSTINAPVDKVWDALLDFPSYVHWNPFVRGQTVLDPNTRQPVAPSSPLQEGHILYMFPVHIPPTMGEPSLFQKQSSYCVVTTLDHVNHRVAWETAGWIPKFLLHAERWQTCVTIEGGKTKYESFEVFSGPVAYAVKWFVGRNLIISTQAMADTLKQRAEQA